MESASLFDFTAGIPRGLKKLVGSPAEHILYQAPCSVLAV